MPLHTLEAQLARDGWLFVRQRGSHRHYRNQRGQRLSFSLHGGSHTSISLYKVGLIRRDMARLAGGARGHENVAP